MGKNGRIVGAREKFDQKEVAFTRLGMGKLGDGPKERWLKESVDPFWRALYGYTRKENSIVNQLRKAVDGPVRPEKVPVEDPSEMSTQIKAVARFFGADLVGVAPLDPAYVYSHRGRNTDLEDGRFGEEIQNDHAYAVVIGRVMDYDRIKASPSFASDAETGKAYAEAAKTAVMTAGYIRELGYPARAHHFRQDEVIHPPLAVAAGLGEMGRFGYVINDVFGPRFRTSVVTTDLPLAPDSPMDLGVSEFCEICQKCADHCPSNSIPRGEKTLVRGVEKWAIDADNCIRFWAAKPEQNLCCANCMSACPYNKRNTWYHRLAVKIVRKSQLGGRLLLAIDDLFYGK